MNRKNSLAAVLALTLTTGLAACATDAAVSDNDAGAAVDVSSYQQAAEKAMEPVTEWTGPTTGPAAKTGVRAMFIACGYAAEGCKGPADAAEEAAEAIGWDVTVVDGQLDPSIYNRSISQAIDQNMDVILLGSISSEAVAESIKRAREAGIVVGSWDSANEPSETGVNFEVDQPVAAQGENMANYMIWKTDGQANAHMLDAPEFKVASTWMGAAKEVLEACDTCTIAKEDQFVSKDAATRLPTLITSTLRQDQSINVVLGAYDAALLAAIPSIKSAGMADRVNVGSFNGIAPMINFVREGDAAATSAVAIKWGTWAAFDTANRILQGEDIVPQNIPTRLITTENIDDIPAGSQWEGDVDYRSHFEKIWSGQS